MTSLLIFLNNSIARADAVLAESEKRKLHEPTVEYFRGQKLIAQQALLMLEGEVEEDEECLLGVIEKGKLLVFDKEGVKIDLIFGNGDSSFQKLTE